ncbi:hypothetical protein OC834_001760 [Tilletia horrida]|uniref:Ribosomal eL28/Mak16 domain-containing protein n=1 Tax=Tilletia horrida TaxID=155126 RepID=A0AAN6GEM7_9BASI|nr:hypothetical protein OC835_004848 [Tilletia horrida]KAK0532954.1 hypothetical protein OC842_003133 [Tilletia horrida]KAK0534780.1 hypothetical protein OC834_001760 [Tilletia horrida]KAK0558648.1 hypothetical protein OC844_004988 [Tilletia horrida]
MPAANVSNDLEWLLVRKTSSYIVKQHALPRAFSREPRNIAHLHSFKYSTTTNAKAVGIEAAPRGLVLTTRKSKAAPGTIKGAHTVTTIKKGGSRRSAGVISNTVAKKGYRRDLAQLAVARASAIHRSQRSRKTRPAPQPRGKKAAAAAATSAPAAEEETA